jgi:hypothetical protein
VNTVRAFGRSGKVPTVSPGWCGHCTVIYPLMQEGFQIQIAPGDLAMRVRQQKTGWTGGSEQVMRRSGGVWLSFKIAPLSPFLRERS